MTRDHGYLGGTHAECDALMKSERGDVLVVIRINRAGELSCAKPCDRCQTVAKEFGIKKILFTDWSGIIQEMKL